MTLLDGRRLPAGSELDADVAVVGAGPAGIVVALELAAAGHRVLVLESGGERYERAPQALSDTDGHDPLHDPMSAAVRRQLGGTSTQWGGRCVPLDPIDFEPRDIADFAAWPIAHAELAAVLQRACDWCECGAAAFDAREVPELAGGALVPGFEDGDVRTSALERWSVPTDFGRRYRAALERCEAITLVTHLTCTEIVRHAGFQAVERLEARTASGAPVRVRARRYVLAGGGLESTRLLMVSDRHDPGGLGNHSGHLGRWYMAHVEARVAHAQFRLPPGAVVPGHERDGTGVYVRRRFTFSAPFQRTWRLPNAAFWLVNPKLSDAAHGDGVLSLVYLLLGSPLGGRFAAERIRQGHLGAVRRRVAAPHLRNVVRNLGPALRFAVRFGYGRYLRRGRKLPGLFVRSAAHRYPLLYHAEHLPNWDSHVELSEERDALGVRRLRTHLRFGETDVEAVERAHRALDRALRSQGLGHVEFLFDDVGAAVREQLRGGTHQLGTTRMSARPEDGVVDPRLAVHGFEDLYVLSGSTFVTSSQANPTLTLVALAVRLAGELSEQLAGGAPRRECLAAAA
jgi:choline dehydrogenase-like flavoprotein